MSSRRLVVCCRELTEYGGIEASIVEADRVATEAGYRVTVATSRQTPGWEARLQPTSSISSAQAKDPDGSAVEFWQRQGSDALVGAEVVHLVGPPTSFVSEALRTARTLQIRAVYEEVEHVTADYAARPDFEGFRELRNLCDAVVVRNEAQGRDFKQHFAYAGPTITVPQWAYGTQSSLLALPLPVRPSDRTVVGALCRFDPVKGLDTLIRGFALAARDRPELRLRIGGSGALEAEVHALIASLAIGAKVDLPGRVTDSVEFFRAVDVFVVSSRVECGPLAGVEAMAAGRAIVSTPVGGMPERLSDEESALFFPTDDEQQLADRLTRLTDDDALLQQLGGAARVAYRERCSSDTSTERLLDAWRGAGPRIEPTPS